MGERVRPVAPVDRAGHRLDVSNNYFKTGSGKVVTQWPYSPLVYWAMTKSLGRWSETTRRHR